MFSCCLLTSGGSGSQEPQGCGLFQCCRHWLQNKYQRIRAFIRRCLPSSTRVVGCEQDEGVVCPTASRSREVPCAATRGQRGLRGAGASAWMGNQIAPTKSSRTELLELEVRQLLPALLSRDVISIFTFLDGYRTFATTDEVLDLLFTEYGYIVAACGDNDSVLQRWKLKLLQFLSHHLPGSDVEVRARRYLRQFRRLHAAEREAGASARGRHREPALERAPAWTVGPAAPSGPEGIEAILDAGAEDSARTEAPAGEAKPLQIVVTALVHCSALQKPPGVRALEEEEAPTPALEVMDVPEPPPNLMEQPASVPEKPVEPPKESAPAPTVEPGEGPGSEGIVAAGDEDLVKAEMLAPEVKVVHVLVEPMVPCPDEEEPPAPMATPEE
ncbi:ral guanine nucleotide dissociation stimulator-like isoform X2 [Canis lupus dingo]|uniref:ral guanine nucleotide dissociation stimulator-like isoform X2 n=1 Tax=Canis lupus dingo TaxID=286419 RepID=UPI000DC69CFD|nr:ral guanine nucleotide dissociation stimulator-like isoform X2 [Canis lupus dingo]